VPQTEERRKVKLHISMNLHGLVAVDSAILHEDEEYEVPVTVTPPAAAAEGAAANGPVPMEAEAAAAAGGCVGGLVGLWAVWVSKCTSNSGQTCTPSSGSGWQCLERRGAAMLQLRG